MQHILRTYRDELKGLAILWIVFFHAQLGLTGPVNVIRQLGYGGVDIFFLLSGFGLYHSLEKSPGILEYTRRRMRRILPTYWPLCLLWLCLILPGLKPGKVAGARMVLGNLLMVGYWGNVPQMLSWYVSGLLTVIVLAPFFHACLRQGPTRRRNALILLGVLFLVGFCFTFDERLIIVSRLPIFVVGMLAAAPANKVPVPAKEGMGLALSFAAGAALLYLCQTRLPETLLDYGMYWYPFALMTLPLCGAAGWVLQKLEKQRKWFAPLQYLGQSSFEIFLLNCGMEVYYKKVLTERSVWLWLAGSLCCLILGCLYHWMMEKLQPKLKPISESRP